jgi:hypothetical protein
MICHQCIRPAALALALLLAGCTDRDAACRLAHLAGPMSVMEGFARGEGITEAPALMPERLVARFLGGGAVGATVHHDSTGMLRLVVPPPPAGATQPTWAVLVTDRTLATLGVILYDGPILPGYEEIGQVEAGAFLVPLLGVRVDPKAVADPRCPFFPESALASTS